MFSIHDPEAADRDGAAAPPIASDSVKPKLLYRRRRFIQG